MTLIDKLVLRRVSSRIAVTVLVFYGIIMLVESLDTWRFNYLTQNSGLHIAVLTVIASAMRWTIKTLPVTVLMGAILGFIDLKSKRELTVIKASGLSIWRIVRAPTIALILASIVIALGAETFSTQVNRAFNPTAPGESSMLMPRGEIWIEQRGGEAHYIMSAVAMQPGGTQINEVTIFDLTGAIEDRITASVARLEAGQWVLENARAVSPDAPWRSLGDYALPTNSTPAELDLMLSSTEDMTFFELANLLNGGVADSGIKASATMRLIKLMALPLVLTGSLFIAFAFTAGYRRNDKNGPAILYGIALGFVVFVITEMADRAGSSGVLDPTFAAIGPAFVAIVIGLTVLLFREDGRA